MKSAMGNVQKALRGKPLDADARDKLRRRVERDGLEATAQNLGIPHNTLTRALAALGLRAGTAVLIEQRLKEVR